MGKHFACKFTYVAQLLIAARYIFRVNLHVLRKSGVTLQWLKTRGVAPNPGRALKMLSIRPPAAFRVNLRMKTHGRGILRVNLRMLRNFFILIPILAAFRVNLRMKPHGGGISRVNLRMLCNFYLFLVTLFM